MTVNTISLKDDPSAETKALWLLREYGFETIQQLDWIAKNNEGEWVVFEVKEKELFTPGRNFPHYGAGLNRRQLSLRTKLLEELGLRTYLVVFVKGTDEVYGAYLDELENKGGFYDTPNGIRIYQIKNFSKGVEDIRGELYYPRGRGNGNTNSYGNRFRMRNQGGKNVR